MLILIFINGFVFISIMFRLMTDNLEVGNNRKALQESEKLLRKHPNLLCARALKVCTICIFGEKISQIYYFHTEWIILYL